MMFEELCTRFADALNTLGCEDLCCDDYCFDDYIELDVPDVLNPKDDEDYLDINISAISKFQSINFIIGIQLTFRNYKYLFKVNNVVATDIVLALISVGMNKTAIRFIFKNSSSTCILLDVYSVSDTILYLEEMNIPVYMLEMYLNYCQNFASKYIREYNTSNEKLRNFILNTFIIKYDHINVLLESLASIEYKVALMNFINNNLIDGMEDITL